MAKITNESLLLVQTGEKLNSIKAVDLKKYYAPLAVQPDPTRNQVGIPGTLFPSEQFDYNKLTGELSLRGDDAEIRELVGYIGYVQNLPPGQDLNNLPVVLTPSMGGKELPGQYYIVIDPDYKYLTNDWGTAYYDPNNPGPSNISRVYVGDEVIKQENGDWIVSRNLVSSNIFMLKDLTSYAHISQIQIQVP